MKTEQLYQKHLKVIDDEDKGNIYSGSFKAANKATEVTLTEMEGVLDWAMELVFLPGAAQHVERYIRHIKLGGTPTWSNRVTKQTVTTKELIQEYYKQKEM